MTKATKLLVILTCISAFAGLLTVKDVGINWDEQCQRVFNGRTNWGYVLHPETSTLLTSNDKYHGPFFEMLLSPLEKLFPETNPRRLYFARHAVTHGFFLLGVLAFALTVLHRTSLAAALAGFAMLAFAPRMWGDSFHNTKDLVLVAFVCLQTYCLFRYLSDASNRKWLWLLGICLGLAVSVRIIAIAFLVTALVAIVWRAPAKRLSERLLAAACCLAVAVVSTYATWPILWDSPLHFVYAFKEMAAFPWLHPTWFRGVAVPSKDLPWFYLPEMISVTTPIPTLLLAAAGFMLLFRRTAQWNWSTNQVFDLAVAANGIGVLIVVIGNGAIVHDGWRHVYFVFPSLVYLACLLLDRLLAKSPRFGLAACIGTSLASLTPLVLFHPYQSVYFNRLAGRTLGEAQRSYEIDYWALSGRQALENILRECPGTHRISGGFEPYIDSSFMLPNEQRARLEFVGHAPGDFSLRALRGSVQPSPSPDPLSVIFDGAVLTEVIRHTNKCLPQRASE